MLLLTIVWLLYVAASIPLVIALLTIGRRDGFALALLSPLAIYWVAYTLSFAIRPTLQLINGFSYHFTILDPASFVVAELLGALGSLALVAGWYIAGRIRKFVLFQHGFRLRTPSKRRLVHMASLVSFIFTTIFAISLASSGVFDGGEGIRSAYLSAMEGRGYIFLFDLCACFFALMGLAVLGQSDRLPVWGLSITIIAFLLVNAVVTNRNFVTLIVFASLLAYVLRRRRLGRPAGSSLIVILLLGVGSIGIWLGVIRADKQWDLAGVMSLFVATFDMSEMLQLAIQRVSTFDLGWAWFEDIAYTYFPRALWHSKPAVYGATYLQSSIVPELAKEGAQTSTFPLGLYGEAYLAFSVLGILLAPLFVGFIMRRVYAAVVFASNHKNHVTYAYIFFFSSYVLLFGNSLAYMRSFGQFLSAMIFNSAIMILIFGGVFLLASLGGYASSSSKFLQHKVGK